MKKYEDMAYMNERGITWLKTLGREDIWVKWVSRIERSMQGMKVLGKAEDYAKRILIEAIWHQGYAKDTTSARNMARCTRRLRQPRDRGEGADLRGFNNTALDLDSQAVPREFIILDEFLENIVRPLL